MKKWGTRLFLIAGSLILGVWTALEAATSKALFSSPIFYLSVAFSLAAVCLVIVWIIRGNQSERWVNIFNLILLLIALPVFYTNLYLSAIGQKSNLLDTVLYLSMLTCLLFNSIARRAANSKS